MKIRVAFVTRNRNNKIVGTKSYWLTKSRSYGFVAVDHNAENGTTVYDQFTQQEVEEIRNTWSDSNSFESYFLFAL